MTSTKDGTVSTAASSPVWLQVLCGVLLASVYIVISAGMILFNKSLMREDRFPFPVFLITLHMVGSLTSSLLLWRLMPSFFPSMPSVFEELLDNNACKSHGQTLRFIATALLPFLPIAASGGMCIVAGTWAYRLASVSFLQMIKESHIAMVYLLMLAFGLEQPRLRNALVLFFVTVSAILAVSNQASLSVAGLVVQMVAGFFGSLQMVLTNVMLAKSGRGKIDPMTMVLCVAPNMLVFLVPASAILWDHVIIERLCVHWDCLACNVLVAFMLQVITAVTIRNLSATGMALVCVAKDLGIVFAASHVLGEQLSRLQVVGFIGSVFGIGLYSAMKIVDAGPGNVCDPSKQHSK